MHEANAAQQRQATLAALLADTEQLDVVRADQDLLPAAVEEGLRWMSPIGTQTRQAVGDVELGGAVIPDGAGVGALVSAANRDESKFADPDRFDIFRPRQVNLAFGGGRHFCAGHAFSRAQIRIALDVLLQHFPRLAADPARPSSVRLAQRPVERGDLWRLDHRHRQSSPIVHGRRVRAGAG